jgi:hypothetical protein
MPDEAHTPSGYPRTSFATCLANEDCSGAVACAVVLGEATLPSHRGHGTVAFIEMLST